MLKKIKNLIFLIIFLVGFLLFPHFYNVNASEININYAQNLTSFRGIGWDVHAMHFSNPNINWSKVEDSLDKMDMEFARVIMFMEWWHPNENEYTFDSLQMQGVYKFLEYADKHNIDVLIGNWNLGGVWDGNEEDYWWLSEICHVDPDNSYNKWFISNPLNPTWNPDRKFGPGYDHPYSEDVFAESIARLVDHLKNVKGFESVKFVSIWNEPNLAYIPHCDVSIPSCENKTYPQDLGILYKKVREHFDKYNLTDIKIVGSEQAVIANLLKGVISDIGLTLSLFAEGERVDKYIDFVSFHHYNESIGAGGITSQVKSQINNNDFDNVKEKIIIGEFGAATDVVPRPFDTPIKKFENSFLSVKKIIAEIKQGAYAMSRWGFNNVADEMNAIEPWYKDSKPIPEAYNPQALLSASIFNADLFTIPQIQISSSRYYLDAVAINFWHNGTKKRAIWLISDGNPASNYGAKLTLNNLERDIDLQKYYLEQDAVIRKSESFHVTQGNPVFTDSQIPGRGIVVYTEYTEILDKLFYGQDIVPPQISSFNVQPRTTTSSTTVSWTVTDNQALSRVEVWRTTDSGGVPDSSNWTQIYAEAISGTIDTGQYPNSLPPGIYWYGIHVLDMAGNIRTEASSIRVTVIGCGDGSCISPETCTTCSQDCGSCPPSPPPPPPVVPICGDTSCNGTETCSSCPQDCGACLDTIKPWVNSFDVQPRTTTGSVTASYTVTDNIALSRVELWRTTDLNGQPNGSNWTQVKSRTISGITSTGSFTDTPAVGTYWYGIHVLDAAGNIGTEASAIKIVATSLPSSTAAHPILKCDFEDTFTCKYGQQPVISSGVTFVQGKEGKGILIDGNDVLVYPVEEGFNKNQAIVEFWVKLLGDTAASGKVFFTVNGLGAWMSKKDPSYSSISSFISPSSNYRFLLRDKSSSSYMNIGPDPNPLSDGAWHHVINQYFKTENGQYRVRIYIDGVLKTDRTGTLTLDPGNLNIYIGSDSNQAQQCNCIIDDLRVNFLRQGTNSQDSPFGISSWLYGHYWLYQGFDRLVKLMYEAGTKWDRASGISWMYVQPNNKSEWQWERFDQMYQAFKNYGIEPVPSFLVGSPLWASSAPTNIGLTDNERILYPPNNIEDWKNFIRETVKRYGCGQGGRCLVKYWELGNEPDGLYAFRSSSYPNNTEKDFFPLMKAAYETIKQTDSNAIVLFPGVTGYYLGVNGWTDRLLALGAGAYCDIFNFHTYRLKDGTPSYFDELNIAKNLLKKYGIENKPIWITETNHSITGIADEQEQARELPIRFYDLLENGAEKVFWFNLRNQLDPNNPIGIPLGLITRDGTIKQSYYAYQDMFLFIPDLTSPVVSVFNVQPRTTTGSITASYTVTDNISLARVELWRTTDSGGAPNGSDWTQVTSRTISGASSSGNFTDTPAVGTYWYGIHVLDAVGNMGIEANAIRVVVSEVLPPPSPICGDGFCNGTENCSSCPQDCGACLDTIKPWVNSFDVQPRTTAGQVTVTYAVADNIALSRVELWRSPDGVSNWIQVTNRTISGITSTGQFTDNLTSFGTYWYGIHVLDASGNIGMEASIIRVIVVGCGDGNCISPENCTTCSRDCGSCPIPPMPSPPVCGDSSCNGTETCSSCPQDCGTCPSPPSPPSPPAPPDINIQSSQTTVTSGQSVTISWSAVNANSCTASGNWSGSRPVSGTETITPEFTSSYTATYALNCVGLGGQVNESVRVTYDSGDDDENEDEEITVEDLPRTEDVKGLIETIANLLRILAVGAGLIMIIISGITIMTSGSDMGKLAKGKMILKWTIIGVIIVLASSFIINLIKEILPK